MVVSSVPPMMFLQQVLALGVQHAHHVGAVVHGEVGAALQRAGDVAVVGLVVLALDGEDADAVVHHQRRRGVILGGERVGGAQA